MTSNSEAVERVPGVAAVNGACCLLPVAPPSRMV